MVKSGLLLKGMIVFIGLVVLAICIFALPAGLRSEHVGGYRPILLGMYVPAIPFYIALYQGLRILRSIDRNQAFSLATIDSLKKIKISALIIFALYGAALPYVFYMANRDDAPGVVMLNLIFTFGPLAIAALAGVLQHVFQDAIAIKSENEQTV